MALNTVALMGRITFEPELKSTNSGTSVTRFQIAVDRNYQASGKEREADFIDCVAWGKTAEFVNSWFHKGQMIALTGEIQTRNFTDKDNNKRKSVEVVANNVSFCGSKENGTQASTLPDINENNVEILEDNDEDLPF